MQRRVWPVWVYYAIGAIAFAIDYATKKIIVREVELYHEIPVIGDFFLITHIRNRGAAFSMLQDQRLFFLIMTVIVTVGIIWYMHRSLRTGSKVLLSGLGLILGGALGNFLDRARFGEVVDFLQFNFGSYTFPIFNAADSAICCGVALVILDTLLTTKRENKKNDANGQEQEAANGRTAEQQGNG